MPECDNYYVLLHYICVCICDAAVLCMMLNSTLVYVCMCGFTVQLCMCLWSYTIYMCMLQYTYLVTSQLEAQRLYFEEKMERIEKEALKQVSKTRH